MCVTCYWTDPVHFFLAPIDLGIIFEHATVVPNAQHPISAYALFQGLVRVLHVSPGGHHAGFIQKTDQQQLIRSGLFRYFTESDIMARSVNSSAYLDTEVGLTIARRLFGRCYRTYSRKILVVMKSGFSKQVNDARSKALRSDGVLIIGVGLELHEHDKRLTAIATHPVESHIYTIRHERHISPVIQIIDIDHLLGKC